METPSERKARLKALRDSQVSGEPADDDQAPAELHGAEEAHVAPTQAPEEPVLRFRNYNVKDAERIAHKQVQAAHPPKAEVPKAEQPTEENEDPEVSKNEDPEVSRLSSAQAAARQCFHRHAAVADDGLRLHSWQMKPRRLAFMHPIILTAVVSAAGACHCSFSNTHKSIIAETAG